jgi:mersacidin/lichenicidin family type 2 lantibiotic
MLYEDIIRAWKDEEYRNSLSEEQRAQLPENPAGMVELSDEAMQTVAGGILGSLFACGGNITEISPICIPTIGAGALCLDITLQV